MFKYYTQDLDRVDWTESSKGYFRDSGFTKKEIRYMKWLAKHNRAATILQLNDWCKYKIEYVSP